MNTNKQIMAIILGIFLVLSLVSLVSALTISSVDTTNQIKPGDTAEVIITLENNGDYDVEDVSVKLDLTLVPFAPFDSSSEKSVDTVDKDNDQTFRFNVIY